MSSLKKIKVEFLTHNGYVQFLKFLFPKNYFCTKLFYFLSLIVILDAFFTFIVICLFLLIFFNYFNYNCTKRYVTSHLSRVKAMIARGKIRTSKKNIDFHCGIWGGFYTKNGHIGKKNKLVVLKINSLSSRYVSC